MRFVCFRSVEWEYCNYSEGIRKTVVFPLEVNVLILVAFDTRLPVRPFSFDCTVPT